MVVPTSSSLRGAWADIDALPPTRPAPASVPRAVPARPPRRRVQTKALVSAPPSRIVRQLVLPATAAAFPNDNPTEVVQAAIREMRREVEHITAALDAVEAELVQREDVDW